MSFGEAASRISYDTVSALEMANFFQAFYCGFKKDCVIWYACDDSDNLFKLPFKFDFSSVCSETFSSNS